jgi:hypothetical protein
MLSEGPVKRGTGVLQRQLRPSDVTSGGGRHRRPKRSFRRRSRRQCLEKGQLNGKQVYSNVNFGLLVRPLEVDDFDVQIIYFEVRDDVISHALNGARRHRRRRGMF